MAHVARAVFFEVYLAGLRAQPQVPHAGCDTLLGRLIDFRLGLAETRSKY